MAVFWAMGITQHTVGVHNVFALADLQMMLGNFGIPGGGVNPLRGQNNVQGACDMGCLVNVYPGYQAVTAEASQRKFEEAWGTSLSNKVGKTVTEIIPGVLEGTTKALYILGENPAMTDRIPITSATARRAGILRAPGYFPHRILGIRRRAPARCFLC